MSIQHKLKVLDLFSGIGGFSLGLEQTGGFETVAFCEIDPYCRAVLRKHWPTVRQYDDVRALTASTLLGDGIGPIDVICGGFPCQDISVAGKRAGLSGARSGLWSEYRRLIGEIRPRFVIAENVPNILTLGLGDVLGDLSALRYDALWECVPASAVGAPHRRDRWWLIAYARDSGQRELFQPLGECWSGLEANTGSNGQIRSMAHPISVREPQSQGGITNERGWLGNGGSEGAMADSDISRLQGRNSRELPEGASEWTARPSSPLSDAQSIACDVLGQDGARVSGAAGGCDSRGAAEQWEPESRLGRVAHGFFNWLDEPADVPRVAQKSENRVHRLKALGNAVVPQIPFLLGQAILQSLNLGKLSE